MVAVVKGVAKVRRGDFAGIIAQLALERAWAYREAWWEARMAGCGRRVAMAIRGRMRCAALNAVVYARKEAQQRVQDHCRAFGVS